jgi:hypothetical protein
MSRWAHCLVLQLSSTRHREVVRDQTTEEGRDRYALVDGSRLQRSQVPARQQQREFQILLAPASRGPYIDCVVIPIHHHSFTLPPQLRKSGSAGSRTGS